MRARALTVIALVVVLIAAVFIARRVFAPEEQPQRPIATSSATAPGRDTTPARPLPTPEPSPTSEATTPAAVELDVIRSALPDNRYWTEQVPTDDPAVLQRRAESHARRNAVHGRILSGTASNDEIDAYFAERERQSRDAIEFARFVLDHYGDALSEQERGLYTLAIDMNGTRLNELTRDKADAVARKERQDEARAAWSRQK